MTTDRLIAWSQQLREVHTRLRSALEIAREAIEDGTAGPTPSRDLLLYCRGFCVALTGHHRGEDTGLFPSIIEARPDLAPVISNLMQDHGMIDYLIGGLERSLESGGSQDELLRHLDGIDAVMQTHFGYEESQLLAVLDVVIPAEREPRDLFGSLA